MRHQGGKVMPKNMFTLTVEQFKLACIDDETFTDTEVKILLDKVIITTEKDIENLMTFLEKYRPKLVDELSFIAYRKFPETN